MEIKDILFLVLALSAAVLTAFMAWFLYYLIAIVRDLRETSKLVHDKVNQVGDILNVVKDRLTDSVSALSILTSVVSKVAGAWQERRSSKKRARESSSDGA